MAKKRIKIEIKPERGGAFNLGLDKTNVRFSQYKKRKPKV